MMALYGIYGTSWMNDDFVSHNFLEDSALLGTFKLALYATTAALLFILVNKYCKKARKTFSLGRR